MAIPEVARRKLAKPIAIKDIGPQSHIWGFTALFSNCGTVPLDLGSARLTLNAPMLWAFRAAKSPVRRRENLGP